jgi:hypothetical protein
MAQADVLLRRARSAPVEGHSRTLAHHSNRDLADVSEVKVPALIVLTSMTALVAPNCANASAVSVGAALAI